MAPHVTRGKDERVAAFDVEAVGDWCRGGGGEEDGACQEDDGKGEETECHCVWINSCIGRVL